MEALSNIFREYDGSKNNKNNADWGAKETPLERRAGNSYADGISIPREDLPSVRAISNFVSKVSGNITRSRLNVTMAFVIWGQFLDHDLSLTEGGKTESMDIPIPKGDPFLTSPNLPFSRAITMPTPPRTVRRFPNEITTWLDASTVYGSN